MFLCAMYFLLFISISHAHVCDQINSIIYVNILKYMWTIFRTDRLQRSNKGKLYMIMKIKVLNNCSHLNASDIFLEKKLLFIPLFHYTQAQTVVWKPR